MRGILYEKHSESEMEDITCLTTGVTIGENERQAAIRICNELAYIVGRERGEVMQHQNLGITCKYYDRKSNVNGFPLAQLPVADFAIPCHLFSAYVTIFLRSSFGQQFPQCSQTVPMARASIRDYDEYYHNQILPIYMHLLKILFSVEIDTSRATYYYFTVGETTYYIRRCGAGDDLPTVYFQGVYHWVNREERTGMVEEIVMGVVQTTTSM